MAGFWIQGVLHRAVGLYRRMARARRGLAAAAQPCDPPGDRRGGASRAPEFALARRGRLARAGAAALLLCGVAAAQADDVVATRIWPARDYTRVTFETRSELKYALFAIKQPERLVLDLDGVDAGPVLNELQDKVAAGDPYIASLRVARNRPGVTRVVLDLKAEVKPQVFTLKPIADYGHRLVLDLYPVVAPDPLAALLELDGKIIGSAPQQPPAKGARPKVARLATIVLDPGHGGEDPGARGRRGSHEKDITLMIARRLKGLIDAEPEMRAVLTRDGDYYLPLNARVEKARKVKADLFVSVHADAFIRPHARGSSVFTLSQRPTSEAARWLAQQENDSDLVGGVNLDRKDRFLAQTLLDLSQTATTDHSLKLGGAVLAELGQVNTLHKARVEQAGFAVLKAPDVPSILVETAFISNPEEEKRLNDQAYQDRLARAILAGIKRYFAKNPPRPQGPLALR